MNYFSSKTREDTAEPSTVFRVSAALLAGAAVLLAFMLTTDAGMTGVTAWVVAIIAAGAAYMLARLLVVVIMLAVAPVLIVTVLVRFFVT